MRLRTVVESVCRGPAATIALASACVGLGVLCLYQEYRIRRLLEHYDMLSELMHNSAKVQDLDLEFLNAEARKSRACPTEDGSISLCAFTTQGQKRLDLDIHEPQIPGQMSTCYLISILHKTGKGNYQRYEDVSLLCVRLLGELRDPVAEPILEDVLQSSSGRLAEACRDSLKMLREPRGPRELAPATSRR